MSGGRLRRRLQRQLHRFVLCEGLDLGPHLFQLCRHLPARFVPDRLIRIHTHEFQKRVPHGNRQPRAAAAVERILEIVICLSEVPPVSLLHGCPGRLLTAWSIAGSVPAGKTIDN